MNDGDYTRPYHPRRAPRGALVPSFTQRLKRNGLALQRAKDRLKYLEARRRDAEAETLRDLETLLEAYKREAAISDQTNQARERVLALEDQRADLETLARNQPAEQVKP